MAVSEAPVTPMMFEPHVSASDQAVLTEDGLPRRPRGACPAGVDPDLAATVEAFRGGRAFPFAAAGRFFFSFEDPTGRVEGVRLRHGLAGHREAQWLTRCAGGVFLTEFEAPAVNRLEYQFGLLLPNGTEEVITDPLNPFTVRDPFSAKSVAMAEGYHVPTHAGPPPAEAVGELLELQLPGPAGQPWRSWVWSPPGDRFTEPLPLAIFLDGGDYLRLAGVRNILENLVSSGRVRRCRALLMSPAARNDEYSAVESTAAYLTMLLPQMLTDVLPMPSEPRDRIAIGASLGGLCLLHAHWMNSDFFGGLLLQSGSFFQPRTDAMEVHFRHFDRITAFIGAATNESKTVRRIPLHITCGRGGENIANNRVLVGSLRRQGFSVSFVEQPDAHNWTNWRDTVGEGLTALLPPASH